jgi:hypothetical protein
MAESTPRSRRGSTRAGRTRRPTARTRSVAARRAARTRAGSRSAARRSTASRVPANGSAASNGNGHHGTLESLTGSIGSAATKARGPLIAGGAAAAGALGGIVLGRRALRPRRKVLGIPVSRDGIGLRPLAHEVRKAGKQIGRMVDEVDKARAQAQKVSKALS